MQNLKENLRSFSNKGWMFDRVEGAFVNLKENLANFYNKGWMLEITCNQNVLAS
jgi:hypothetical protein